MEPKTGHYLGTDARGRWWDRYRRNGFLARGNGRLWTDQRGIFFHRYLTREPLFIPWAAVRSIDTTTFHAGRWAWGLPILRVGWAQDDQRLRSGFIVSGRRAAQAEALEELRREHAARAAAQA